MQFTGSFDTSVWGPLRSFTVAEKHVNNTTQQPKNHGILIVPFIAKDLFLQSKFRVLDVYTAFTNQQR